MNYIFIVVFIFIVLAFLIKIINPKIKKKKTKENLINFLKKENLTFEENKNKSSEYDLRVLKENKIIYIKLVIIPNYSEIQINNKSTWEVKYGAGDSIGKVQPHKRYLTEIVQFMNKDFGEVSKKLIIFSPTPKKIVKYLNENEIDFVKSTTDVYGANITSYEKYDIIKKM